LVSLKVACSNDRGAVKGGEPSARRAGGALGKKTPLDPLRSAFARVARPQSSKVPLKEVSTLGSPKVACSTERGALGVSQVLDLREAPSAKKTTLDPLLLAFRPRRSISILVGSAPGGIRPRGSQKYREGGRASHVHYELVGIGAAGSTMDLVS
jgi:hypothetical protein